jgi:hypothetical protein
MRAKQSGAFSPELMVVEDDHADPPFLGFFQGGIGGHPIIAGEDVILKPLAAIFSTLSSLSHSHRGSGMGR